MSNLKIEVEVTELMLEQMKAGDTVVIHTHAELPEPKEPKLYSGYTEEQIERIIDGGYLVSGPQLDFTEFRKVIKHNKGRFKVSQEEWITSIQLVREVGIRQPWFGDEYDGHPDDLVWCISRDRLTGFCSAQDVTWEEVTEFILLEAALNG
jgi:hypothetical protein